MFEHLKRAWRSLRTPPKSHMPAMYQRYVWYRREEDICISFGYLNIRDKNEYEVWKFFYERGPNWTRIDELKEAFPVLASRIGEQDTPLLDYILANLVRKGCIVTWPA